MNRSSLQKRKLGTTILLILIASAIILVPPVNRTQVSAQVGGRSDSKQAAQEAKKADSELTLGTRLERELKASDIHSYKVTLSSGQYMHLVVEQKGIDVVVTLFGPAGQKLTVVDSPNGNQGPEPIYVIAKDTGEYRVEVRPVDEGAAPGPYEIRVEDLRPATSKDVDRVAAEWTFAEGLQLFGQSTAETRQKAIDKYLEAVTLWRKLGDRAQEATTLNEIGGTYWQLGENQKALEYHSQALSIRRLIGDRHGEAQSLHNVGVDYWQLGDSQKALECYNRALPLRRAVADREGEAITLNAIALAHNNLGDLNEALDYLHQSLTVYRAIGDRRNVATTLHNMSKPYFQLGDWQKALTYQNEALAIARDIGDRDTEGFVLQNTGYIYGQLGDDQKAIEYYDQALSLLRALGDRNGESVTLNSIGLAYRSIGDSQKALDYFNQALALTRVVKDRRGEALALQNVGTVYKLLGDSRKALDYFSQTLVVLREIGDRLNEAVTLSLIGTTYSSTGEWQEGIRYLEEALSLHRDIGDRVNEATTLKNIARIERDRDSLDAARNHIETALSIVEDTRSKFVSQQLRTSFSASRQEYYELYIDVLMRMHHAQPLSGFDAAALQASERARARSLLDLLNESRAGIREGVDPVLLERERRLQQQLSVKSERLTRLLTGKHTEDQKTAASKELELLLADYKELESQIRIKSPRYAALTQPQPLSLKEIQTQVLDDDTLLLEYALGEERSYLWAVSATSVSAFELPKRADIELLSRRIYELLTARNKREKFETPKRRRDRIAQADAEYTQTGRTLSEMLLKPVTTQMKNKRLLIVADGVLQYIPFPALPSPEDTGEASPSKFTPLLARHEVVSLPSASTLAVLRRELVARKKAPKITAVLADPVFDKDDNRVKTTKLKARLAEASERSVDGRRGSEIPQTELIRSVRDFGPIGDTFYFPRLPSTRLEAEAIVAAAPPANSRKAVDFAASKVNATDAALGQYRYVHFATHALINSTHPELSGIVLSLVDEKGENQDGFLLLHEIYNLKLPADMVVLSGCRTALGKEIKGEGLIGFTRGFMYAGAGRVLVSLWDINDESTAGLMSRLYREMLGRNRLSPTASLRMAQLSLQRSSRWQAPYYWAGFILQGEYK
jgi:CHAT domain-containing protein/Tfp pilus assembly protein PilF